MKNTPYVVDDTNDAVADPYHYMLYFRTDIHADIKTRPQEKWRETT